MNKSTALLSENGLTEDLLRQQIAEGEGDRIEFKLEARPELVGSTIAAFLNARGGTLFVGMDDSGNAVGASSSAANSVKEVLARGIVPHAPISVEVVLYEGKSIVVVGVPAGSDGPYLFGDQIFVRSGAQTRLVTQKELASLIGRRSTTSQRWERLPALGFELQDLDEGQIARTAQEAQERRLYEWRAVKDNQEILEQLYLVDATGVRNSAIVLFAREPQSRFPQTRMRVVRFASDDLEEILANRILQGNAFSLLEQAMELLTATIPTTSTLPREGVVRQDRPAYPLPVLREALLNALVHRDYAAFDGSISITLFPERMEIWNPGSLPTGMTIADLEAGGVSRPHNPDIANVFLLRGLMERTGIGAQRMIRECIAAGLPAPEWTVRAGGIHLTLHLAPPRQQANLPLNERMEAFLRESAEGQEISLRAYASRYATSVSERSARSDLKQMTEMGLLQRLGQDRNARYRRTVAPYAS